MVDMYNLSWHYKRLMKIKYIQARKSLFIYKSSKTFLKYNILNIKTIQFKGYNTLDNNQ